MRQILLSLALILPFATDASGQAFTPRVLPGQGAAPDPHQGEVPDLQLIPPQGLGQEQPKGPPEATPPGQRPQQGQQAQRPGRPPPKPPETEEQLLARLAKAPDRRGARDIERELVARWSHSDSPTASLLLKRADDALKAHDVDTAREIAQKLTDIAPEFAEAWHRRATLAAQKEDYSDALTSLRHALALQPKNFAALAELGQILEEYEDKPRALEAYRQAKAIHPFIDGIDDRIRDLTKDVEGQGI